MSYHLAPLALQLGELLKQRRLKVVTAESCTGGWIATEITAIAGSSDWFERGFVTYSNEAKRELLGVKEQTLGEQGAVSEAVAREMAEGALRQSRADVAVAVTGVAGPTGGTPAKPVGTVCIGWAFRGGTPRCVTRHFGGDRRAVREQSVAHSLQGLIEMLGEKGM